MPLHFKHLIPLLGLYYALKDLNNKKLDEDYLKLIEGIYTLYQFVSCLLILAILYMIF